VWLNFRCKSRLNIRRKSTDGIAVFIQGLSQLRERPHFLAFLFRSLSKRLFLTPHPENLSRKNLSSHAPLRADVIEFCMRTAKLNNLTFARFLAALLVIFHHAPKVLQDPQWVPPAWLRMFFGNGYVGVTFFFILSGFVISASSFDKLHVPSFNGALIFFVRRVIRIVPVWLFLSLPFVMPAFFLRPIPWSLFRFLTFTQAWSADQSVAFGYLSVAWTLSCEMFFYAMFPLTAFVMGRLQDRFRHAGAGLILFAILVPLGAYLLFVFHPALATLDFTAPNGPHRWLYRNPAMRFSEFLLGVGMFLCFRQYARQLQQATQRWIWLGVLIVAVAVLLALMSCLPMSAMTLTLAYIVPFALIIFSLAAIEINEKPWAIRASLPLLLGEASYSLYLAHQQYGLLLFTQLLGADMPRLGLLWVIVLTVALSVGLYKLIEKPLRALLNRYLERLQLAPDRSMQPPKCVVETRTSVLP
jgi:peptidoglycan/LPS O-acetylase OafA/YrhL